MQTYYALSDLLANELRKRIAAYNDFYHKFEVILLSADMSSTEIVDCAETYWKLPEIDAEFPYELVHFLHFLSTQTSQTPQVAMLTLRANNLPATYPNFDIALRIYLCNFGTNVPVEQTFSALKHVKNELGAIMTQSRWTALFLLYIDKKLGYHWQTAWHV